MNSNQMLIIPLLLAACVVAGFAFQAIRHAGWRAAFGWFAFLTGMAWGASAIVTNAGLTGSLLLQLTATLLPLCVMMIPLLGMLALGWLTGAQLAAGFLHLKRKFFK